MRLYELYQEPEGSEFTHDGRDYDLNALLLVTGHFETHDIPIDQVVWVLEFDEPDPKRVAKADTQKPILVTWWEDEDGHRLVVLDGLHRIARAQQDGDEFIRGRYVDADDLAPCLVER